MSESSTFQQNSQRKAPVILHAPTDRVRKGTDIILQAIEMVRSNGYEFEFRLIENKSQEEVIHEIACSDIVIDQVGAGMYGMISIESMMHQKPVICHIEERFLESCKNCPIYRVDPTPTSIAFAIRDLLEKPERCEELGRRGEQYIRDVHSIENVVRRLKQI